MSSHQPNASPSCQPWHDAREAVVAMREDPPERRLTSRARILELLERRIARNNGECICDLIALRDFVQAEQQNDKKGDA